MKRIAFALTLFFCAVVFIASAQPPKVDTVGLAASIKRTRTLNASLTKIMLSISNYNFPSDSIFWQPVPYASI